MSRGLWCVRLAVIGAICSLGPRSCRGCYMFFEVITLARCPPPPPPPHAADCSRSTDLPPRVLFTCTATPLLTFALVFSRSVDRGSTSPSVRKTISIKCGRRRRARSHVCRVYYRSQRAAFLKVNVRAVILNRYTALDNKTLAFPPVFPVVVLS